MGLVDFLESRGGDAPLTEFKVTHYLFLERETQSLGIKPRNYKAAPGHTAGTMRGMKTIAIIALLVISLGGAYLSRPSQADFTNFIKAQNGAVAQPASIGDVVKVAKGTFATDIYLQTLTFQDYRLWTTVAQNGQTQYVGVFAHWWKLSSGSSSAPAKS